MPVRSKFEFVLSEQAMKHYGITQWVDFTRGIGAPDRRREMQDHLRDCQECSGLMRFCERVAEACGRIAQYQVPEAVVEKARAILPARPVPEPKRAFRIPIELIYDSFLVPAPAGLRSSWQIGWQALFQAGDCSVDLRVEPELRSSKASLIGQISNHMAPQAEMGDIPVFLKSGKQVVAETRSNRFGEFQMEYQQQGRLQLCIYLDGGKKCIQVPLKRLASDKPASAARIDLNLDAKPREGGEE
jgi:hypothetical protein